ncbi:hypothetical protein MWU65_07600 [Cellulophaga sp. F20128]|uniref:hypothetical protein n=1 Tax=Cellulophaga sp. F20128 TaxID=2926413 RepID=UPI001FF1F1C9|nr:hypothetical protein [Cellulophaga sp. F20128]MCK0157041.1 hypothetical protein [Cellulophaga sp. F20128]
MKKMTLFTLILSCITMHSCSIEEQSLQEELIATNFTTSTEQKYDYLYGIQMYYLSAESEIKRLELLKIKLVAELEKGNKEVMKELEGIQVQIEKLTRLNAYLISIKPPVGPNGPIPPPKPCLMDKESNCDPKQKFTSKTLIVLGKQLIVTDIIVKNVKNQLVDTRFEPTKDQFNQSALQLQSNFKGEGIMYTTLKIEAVGEITIPTPIVRL